MITFNLAIVRYHVRHVEHELPKRVLNVTRWGKCFCEVHWSALLFESIKDSNELPVRFIPSQVIFSFDKNVSLIVAVKTPVVLVEATQSYHLAVIDLNCFHVQILEGLLGYCRSVILQSLKEVRIKMCFVAGLVSVASSDDVYSDPTLDHRFDQLIFELVDVLYIRLNYSDICFSCFYHVQHLLTYVCLVRWLLLQKLATCACISQESVKRSKNFI